MRWQWKKLLFTVLLSCVLGKLILEVLWDCFRSGHDRKSSSGSYRHALSLGTSVVSETPKGCWHPGTCTYIHVHCNTQQCFPLGKEKSTQVNILKPAERKQNIARLVLSKWPLLVTGDFGPSQTTTYFQMESSYSHMQGNRLTRPVWGTVMGLLQKQPLEKNMLFTHSLL